MAKEKETGKIDRAYELYQQLKAQGLKPKEVFEKIAAELGISVHSARSYVWRKEKPEDYRALLNRYFEKKKKAKEVLEKAVEEMAPEMSVEEATAIATSEAVIEAAASEKKVKDAEQKKKAKAKKTTIVANEEELEPVKAAE